MPEITSLIKTCTPSTFQGITKEYGVIPQAAITNPESADFCTFMNLISNILAKAFELAFWVAVGFIGYAAYLWLTSMGDAKKTQAALKMLQSVVIGLIIIFSARAILSLIFLAFGIPASFLPW